MKISFNKKYNHKTFYPLLQQRDSFFKNAPEGIGICGLHISERGSFHVGLFCNWQGESQVIHFITDNIIKVQNTSAPNFASYYFIALPDFPSYFIDSLLALLDILSLNPPADLFLDLKSIIYNGGKFEITTGKYLNNTDTLNIINCSVFVLALLQTYDYNLLDWETWPPVHPDDRNKYLEDWLNYYHVSEIDKEYYYNFNKEIRGKHVLSAPLANHHPVSFTETNDLSEQILNTIKN